MKTRRFASLSRILILAIAVCAFLSLAVPAEAVITYQERAEIGRVNWDRHARGIKTMVIGDGLSWEARRHSCQMAAKGKLYHSTDLTTRIKNWRYLGENVGVSWSPIEIHKAFMKSTPHRINILNKNYREVGVGICQDKFGTYWMTQIFRG